MTKGASAILRDEGSAASLLPAYGPPSTRASSQTSHEQFPESPYGSSEGLRHSAFSDNMTNRYSLPADPRTWGSTMPEAPEYDDAIHNPTYKKGKLVDDTSYSLSIRGLANVFCLLVLLVALMGLFVGYPVLSYIQTNKNNEKFEKGYNLGGINSTGQIPEIPGNRGLIDEDTPRDVYSIRSLHDGRSLQLVFSDEFNEDGRTFYPGDDPYWEAGDLHYWVTDNLEWYDPAAVTTANGFLRLKFDQKQTHGLDFEGGMISTWNKFCFTGGYVEASVVLPGASTSLGLWPAIWTMGNLGRAGYGATLEGMWPYSYDACDVGTAPNQTVGGAPAAATTGGPADAGGALSYLPGQRLSRCTCDGEDHPGPKHQDGSYVGRSAPEIDMIEAEVKEATGGEVSQSVQFAPFNNRYRWHETAGNFEIFTTGTEINSYRGGEFQQAISATSHTNQAAYETSGGAFDTYGFEYKPGFDDAYITWMASGRKTWTLRSGGLAADLDVQISARPVPQEPMYIITNLGMSDSFGDIVLSTIPFPVHMYVDYIRVYQDPDFINIGCDPKDFPTQAYINKHLEAYMNPNLTTWEDDYKQPMPKNSYVNGGQC